MKRSIIIKKLFKKWNLWNKYFIIYLIKVLEVCGNKLF